MRISRGDYSDVLDLGAPGWDNDYGAGRVDAYEAVVAAMAGACAGDVTGDGVADTQDLAAVILAWGPCHPSCPEDTNMAGVVDIEDLTTVVLNWGKCP